ncbi:MAG TPA: ABC transporter ATP-binding protein [Acidimicrobiales bacterium]|jgi:ABC-2 type transport system ATP-binding protein
MDVVTCHRLVRTFGSQTVLDGVDLTVAPGTIVGLIGPSGCGKTTLVRALLGIIEPTSGEVRVLGTAPTEFSSAQRTRIGYMPQAPALFPNLSINHNLRFAASLYGVRRRGRRRRLKQLLDFVGLTADARKLAGAASGGMQRRLALAQALVPDPELIVLDEPTAGVDPILRARFWSYFRDLRDAGRTLVVSTQYVGEAVDCDVVAVMCAGRIVALEAPDTLRRRAFGGDIVDLSAERGWFSREEIEKLAAEPYVIATHRTADGLRMVVEDATTDTPRLLGVLQNAEVGPVTVNQITPDYDEVFVAIMRASDEASCAVPA